MVNEKYKDHSGHVVTSDLSIIPNEDLKQDFKRGTKYRPYANAFENDDSNSSPCKDGADAKKLLKWSLQTYITASSEMNEIDPDRYKKWQEIIERKIDERLVTIDKQIMDKQQDQTDGQTMKEREQKEEEKTKALKDLKKRYAVLVADKGASTYVIHCKVHLAKQVMDEINNNGTYKKVEDSTIKEVQDRHAEWMIEERLAEPQDEEDPNAIRIPEYRKLFSKLPRLGVSIKVHKQNKPRFMARCYQTTLTQLGEWLTRTLKAMSVESEEVWKDMFLTAGVITTAGSSTAISR